MQASVLTVLIPILVGASIVLQAQFMGQMDRAMGTLESMAVTYGSGGLLILLLILIRQGGNLTAGQGLPWYVFTAGLCGLIIVGGLGFSAARIGLVTTFTVVVATQFLLGAMIDHFGFFGSAIRAMSVSRVAGMGLLLGGVWLIIR